MKNLKYNHPFQHNVNTSFIIYTTPSSKRYKIAGLDCEQSISSITNGNYTIFYDCLSPTTKQNMGRIPGIELYPTSVMQYVDGETEGQYMMLLNFGSQNNQNQTNSNKNLFKRAYSKIVSSVFKCLLQLKYTVKCS